MPQLGSTPIAGTTGARSVRRGPGVWRGLPKMAANGPAGEGIIGWYLGQPWGALIGTSGPPRSTIRQVPSNAD